MKELYSPNSVTLVMLKQVSFKLTRYILLGHINVMEKDKVILTVRTISHYMKVN